MAFVPFLNWGFISYEFQVVQYTCNLEILIWTFTLSQGSCYIEGCIRTEWAKYETDLIALSLKILKAFINCYISIKFKLQLCGSIIIWFDKDKTISIFASLFFSPEYYVCKYNVTVIYVCTEVYWNGSLEFFFSKDYLFVLPTEMAFPLSSSSVSLLCDVRYINCFHFWEEWLRALGCICIAVLCQPVVFMLWDFNLHNQK